jgi:hypothetical protein
VTTSALVPVVVVEPSLVVVEGGPIVSGSIGVIVVIGGAAGILRSVPVVEWSLRHGEDCEKVASARQERLSVSPYPNSIFY